MEIYLTYNTILLMTRGDVTRDQRTNIKRINQHIQHGLSPSSNELNFYVHIFHLPSQPSFSFPFISLPLLPSCLPINFSQLSSLSLSLPFIPPIVFLLYHFSRTLNPLSPSSISPLSISFASSFLPFSPSIHSLSLPSIFISFRHFYLLSSLRFPKLT